jgi:hypothetical protein
MLRIFDPQGISINRPTQAWTITNSFLAAYVIWDKTKNISTSHPHQSLQWGGRHELLGKPQKTRPWEPPQRADSQLETEREFDYDEYPLEQFYNLILETSQEFETETKQLTTIGIELSKNPLLLSGEGMNSHSAPEVVTTAILPSPYLSQDLISKKNYLGLFIEHEITLSDHLSLSFEGTLDVVIGDRAI